MASTERLVLRVPLLLERPVTGPGCRAVLAEEIVEQLDPAGYPAADPGEVDGKTSQQPLNKEENA